MDIERRLIDLQDTGHQAFTQKLIPTLPLEYIIGVRIPTLRALAKDLSGSDKAISFMQNLPHSHHEENMLHAFLIENEKDVERLLYLTEEFLPYLDNWATCDSFAPGLFKRYPQEMLPHIHRWMECSHIYTKRYGMGLLLRNYLDDHFEEEMPGWVSRIESREYYVSMMQAWYFATALTKQYETALPYIQEGHLDKWTHNKAIQKAIESRLIPLERKQHLRSLKRK